jgi:hypothetical protein
VRAAMSGGFTRIAVSQSSRSCQCSEHLKYALLNPRSYPCGFAPEGFIILGDSARHCMVISQVKSITPFPGLCCGCGFMIYIYLSCGALNRLRPGFELVSASSTPFLNDVFTKLLSDTDVCEFDAVIIVDHPGVSSNQRHPSPPLPPVLSSLSPLNPNIFVTFNSYTRPTCGHSPHPHPSQIAYKIPPHPCNSLTCASHRQTI